MLNAHQAVTNAKFAALNFSTKYKIYHINESGTKEEISGVVIEGRKSPVVFESTSTYMHGSPPSKIGGNDYFAAYNTSNGSLVYQPDWNELTAQALTIDSLITGLAPSSYREIIKHPKWLEIYKPNISSRQRWNWETNAVDTLDSDNLFACRLCGVILEKEQIEIDHQRTKTTGIKTVIPEHNLWGATLKLFRYANLTRGSAIGFKANKLNLSGTPSNPLDKYQLDNNGIFILSILLKTKSDSDIQRNAETAIPNLRPLCGGCNKRDGEPYTGLPWNK